ncbi:MAG: glutamate-1-semialdehyde-2,1-aminomutase [Coxiellaceae bacterium]|nr:glutamate-1-semialdehyde-2,1-aminomutase [Coxiellaceae bacterium]
MNTQRSQQLFNEAQQSLPGGVNSPVRSFAAVGGTPRFIQSANGAYLTDCDNNRYIDYVGAFGPMILGHNNPQVTRAIIDQAQQGLSFGAPCELEVRLSEQIQLYMPQIEKCRLVNSGTEATMTAIRLARGITHRNKIITFEGCYHGHADSFLVKAGSGALTLGTASSAGVTPGTAQDTLVATYNHLDSVQSLFEQHRSEIAAIIIEPIAGNMNFITPTHEFLTGLRALCNQNGALLIFDEVMTGFRVALGGAQSLYPVEPDLTTLGKVIGGGLPIGALGGKAILMDHLAPLGNVYQAGTLSGNPISMAAGLATLKQLTPAVYKDLNILTQKLVKGMTAIASKHGQKLSGHAIGGMFGIHFTDQSTPAKTYADITKTKQDLFKLFFKHMLNHGIYFAPSSYEAGFISLAHTPQDIDQTLDIFDRFTWS